MVTNPFGTAFAWNPVQMVSSVPMWPNVNVVQNLPDSMKNRWGTWSIAHQNDRRVLRDMGYGGFP
jgi:hypothetical protein